MASYIRTSDHLTIVFDDGVTATVYDSATNFTDVRDALNAKDWDLVRELALPIEQIKSQVYDTFGISEDLVTIEHGVVSFKGSPMHNTLTDRMIQMLGEGFDISPLKLFLINLQNNPSYRAVNELYGFLEKGNLPITEDGHFLAYKKVNSNYRDVHTGKFDNIVGQIVEMPRNEVDEDSRNECSNGLHFCSREYLSNFSGEHTMIVKINPADVVAIPADYNSSKGRTCRYEVIGEVEPDGNLEGLYRDTGTHDYDDSDDYGYDYDDSEEDDSDDYVYGTKISPDDENVYYDNYADSWNQAEDDGWTSNGYDDEESEIDELNSAFVGIPSDEPVTIPRSVAIDIARDLDLEDKEDEKPKVLAISRSGNMHHFKSIKDASVYTGVAVSAIHRVLRGERKTAGGYEFQYGFEFQYDIGQEITFEDSTIADDAALSEHQKHGTIFGGAPHHTGGKHNARKC